jgi:hypothetical protein
LQNRLLTMLPRFDDHTAGPIVLDPVESLPAGQRYARPWPSSWLGQSWLGQSWLGQSWVGQSWVGQSWVGMGGYLAAGVVLGLILIVAVAFSRRDAAAATAMPPGTITDNVVHLHADQIGTSCWQGTTKSGPARITVSLEVGVDGKVRYAAAAGESATMRGCVEAHVKSWEFLPQTQAATMVLPFEIDRGR